MQALNEQAQKILKLFGHELSHVFASAARSRILHDTTAISALRLTTGHLRPHPYGAKPPKGQDVKTTITVPFRARLGWHIDDGELFQTEAFRPKPATNEVAPASTLRPLKNGNVATDHQQTVMQVLTRVAQKYGMAGLDA